MKKLKWNEAKDIIDNNKEIIFLEFSTTWCGDCKMMNPFIKQVEEHFKEHENIVFIEVDAEEANLLRKEEKFKVGKVPSFYIINKESIKHVGYEFQPTEKLIKAINEEIK